MAVKDHSLDGKIIEAATGEFLEHGYRKASLIKIAERAGLTTGALYTRYKSKDDLFCSLLEELLQDLRQQGKAMADQYRQVEATPEGILAVIRSEEQAYLDVLFRHYDACVLLYCRSSGSSMEEKLRKMMDRKASQTVEYLRKLSRKTENLDGLELIIASQFHLYGQILERGYSRERAITCIRSVEQFQDAGWKDLLGRIL